MPYGDCHCVLHHPLRSLFIAGSTWWCKDSLSQLSPAWAAQVETGTLPPPDQWRPCENRADAGILPGASLSPYRRPHFPVNVPVSDPIQGPRPLSQGRGKPPVGKHRGLSVPTLLLEMCVFKEMLPRWGGQCLPRTSSESPAGK